MRRKSLKKIIKRMRKARERKPISRKQLLELLLPGLNWLFGQEYDKYDGGHKMKKENK